MKRPDLEAIQARCEAATPGPWVYFYKDKYDEHHVGVPAENCNMNVALFPDGCPLGEDIARFIAKARQDIPDLLAYVKELEDALKAIRDEDTLKQQVQKQSSHGL